MKLRQFLLYAFTGTIMWSFSSCSTETKSAENADSTEVSIEKEENTSNTSNSTEQIDTDAIKVASAKTILERKQVPILCYHQIRNWTEKDGKVGKDYITPIETFKSHIKMLADSGYNTILPDQLYAYLNEGKPLPEKPVMITFDDTGRDQYTVAAPELKKYGFKAVYFIMTVSIGKKGLISYMSKDEIKELSDAGNVIGSHTYDHKNVKKYAGNDWVEQIEKPSKKLEEITGKKIEYFAYPFGLWNPEAIPELKKRGMKAAFILATKRDEKDPLYTIRRIIASGYWDAKTLHRSMVNSF